MIEENTVVREYTENSSKINNEYYKLLECINVDKLIADSVCCPWLAEELLDECTLESYDGKYCKYYLNVVEAFDKTWVFINQYGDDTSTVHINYDGSVYSSSCSHPSPDLREGHYYVGDEYSYMGEVSPFETNQEWLWASVEVGCKTLELGLSKETLGKFLLERKGYLEDQVKLQNK